MAIEEGRTSRFVKGLRTLLIQRGAPEPLVIGAIIHRPDTVIGITPYHVDDTQSDIGNDIVAVQFRFRCAANDGMQPVWDMQDMIKQVMNSVRYCMINDIHVVVNWRQSSMELGLDEKDRPEITDNYYFRTDSTALTP